jgi:hypothetical protein
MASFTSGCLYCAGKSFYSLDRRLVEPVRTPWRRETSLLLLRIKPRFLHHLDRSLVTSVTESVQLSKNTKHECIQHWCEEKYRNKYIWGRSGTHADVLRVGHLQVKDDSFHSNNETLRVKTH